LQITPDGWTRTPGSIFPLMMVFTKLSEMSRWVSYPGEFTQPELLE
jgi:hypothetical protein